MDAAEPSRDLPRPPRLPCPPPGVRGVRTGQGLPVLRRRPHRPGHRGSAGERSRDRASAGAGRTVSRSARWTAAVLIILVALGYALWRELGTDTSGPVDADRPAARDHRDADTPEALAQPRARADLAPCPSARAGAGPQSLRGITLECAGDGSMMD